MPLPPFDAAAADQLLAEAWDIDLKQTGAQPRGPRLDALENGDYALVSIHRGGCYLGERLLFALAGWDSSQPWIRGIEVNPWESPEEYSDPILSVPWRSVPLALADLLRLQNTLDYHRQPPAVAAEWEFPNTYSSLRIYWKLRGEEPWVEEFGGSYRGPDVLAVQAADGYPVEDLPAYRPPEDFLGFIAMAEAAGAFLRLPD